MYDEPILREFKELLEERAKNNVVGLWCNIKYVTCTEHNVRKKVFFDAEMTDKIIDFLKIIVDGEQ